MKNSRQLSILFKLTLVIGCSLGIWLNLRMSDNIAAVLSYYTLQSNILILVLFTVLLIRELLKLDQKGAAYYIIKGACTIAILVTFIVFHLLLRPQISAMAPGYDPNGLRDILVHTFTPIMAALDYVLFDRKGELKWYYPLLWLILPMLYPVYVLVYAELGGRFLYGEGAQKYPYFFLNVDEYGVAGVLGWIAAIAAAFLVLSYVIVALDNFAGRKWEKPAALSGCCLTSK